MELLFFMGLVTPLIQFCRVISSGMVEPSSSQSSKAFFWYFLVYGRQRCFPSCYATINSIRPLHHLLQDSQALLSGEGVLTTRVTVSLSCVCVCICVRDG